MLTRRYGLSKAGKAFLALGTALAIVAVAGVLLFAKSNEPALVRAPSVDVEPRPAPDFELKLYSGETVRLSDFKGDKPVVINFWASWCPPCREEAPALAEAAARFEGEVVFLGIVINDSQAAAEAFMDEFGITYGNGPDDSNIARAYRLTGIPETFWIDKKGRIVAHWIGAIDEDRLVGQTRKLL
jgi:cytochrome c biogenesis protein CcmG, thiol:disulfide interchange protein DsbE